MDAETLFTGPFPELRDDRLLLRELRSTDAPALLAVFGDDEVTRYYDLETFTDLAEAHELAARWRQRFERHIGLRWAICHVDTPDLLLGTCGHNLWIQGSARAIVGFDLARAHWRQGIMRQALTLVLDFGFQQMSLNRVEAVVFRDNVPSCGLLESLGFEREGLLREYECLRGRYEDMFMYSLLRRDWRP